MVLSDVVVLNKTDGLSVAEINNSHKKIQQINAWAQIINTNYGRIPGFQLNTIRQNFKPEVNDAKTKNKHWQIQTKTMYFKNPLPRAEFLRWLDYSLDVYKNKVYRVKGIVCFEDEMYETIIQGVGGGYELEEGNLIHGEKTGKLVFIGKDLESLKLISL